MEFHEAVKRRHSVRKFQPSEIGEDALLRILEAGRLAPSGCNVQNREFIVLRDRALLRTIHEKIQPDFLNAAAAICLVMDPAGTKSETHWIEDAAAAAACMLLAIANEGYDSVWVEGTLLRQETWAKDLLGVPQEKRLFILMPIGKALEPPSGAGKRPLAELVHYDRYGAPAPGPPAGPPQPLG